MAQTPKAALPMPGTPPVDPLEAYRPRSAYGRSTSSPLAVVLDLSGIRARAQLEVWVKSSAAADFLVEGSRGGDPGSFRLCETLSLPAAGERHKGYANAYPYIRVRILAANDSEIEIVASR